MFTYIWHKFMANIFHTWILWVLSYTTKLLGPKIFRMTLMASMKWMRWTTRFGRMDEMGRFKKASMTILISDFQGHQPVFLLWFGGLFVWVAFGLLLIRFVCWFCFVWLCSGHPGYTLPLFRPWGTDKPYRMNKQKYKLRGHPIRATWSCTTGQIFGIVCP